MDEDATTAATWTTYLIEGYRPGYSVEALTAAVGRLRAAAEQMAREGEPVRYVRSAVVPEDESCLVFIEAASETVVREAYARACVQFERISIAIPVEETAPEKGVRK